MIIDSAEENLKIATEDPINSEKNLDLNIGKWTNEENLKYAIFMDFHKQTLSSRQRKKFNLYNFRDFKVFEEMSKFIVSRNTVQCRSHHQKLEERFKNFKRIISAVKNEMGRKQYKAEFKKWTNNGESLVIEASKLKENVDLSQVSTKKDHVKEEMMEPKVEAQNSEANAAETVFPLLNYQPFLNPYNYSIQNMFSYLPQSYC